MFITYKLKKTEDFKAVARKYKLKDWKTTWGLPQNKRLRSQRKYIDKVQAGDTLVILDPKATLRTVKFLGTTYNIPDAEWDTTKREVMRAIERKFLPKLVALKKTYDDDYNYMWSIANENGFVTGLLATVVENLSFADVPTKEMSAVSKSVDNVRKALKKRDVLACIFAMAAAQAAMKKYVDASEKYRKRVTGASTGGVEFLEFTRDKSFQLLGILAKVGIVMATPAAAFKPVEIGAAVGAGTALIKSASNEVGNYLANNPRTSSEITLTILKDTYLGAAEGAFGAFVFSKVQGDVSKEIAKKMRTNAPVTVETMIKGGKIKSKWTEILMNKHGAAVTSDVVAISLERYAVGTCIKWVTDWAKTKSGVTMLGESAISSMGAMKGTEKDAAVGKKMGASLISAGAIDEIVAHAIKQKKAAIDKAAKAKYEELEKEAA